MKENHARISRGTKEAIPGFVGGSRGNFRIHRPFSGLRF